MDTRRVWVSGVGAEEWLVTDDGVFDVLAILRPPVLLGDVTFVDAEAEPFQCNDFLGLSPAFKCHRIISDSVR